MERMVIILVDYEVWVGLEGIYFDFFYYVIKWFTFLNFFKVFFCLLIYVFFIINL